MKSAATALAALCCLCASAASEAQPRPRWIGGLAMDRDASRSLRATDAPTRRAADTVSWAVVGGLMAAPVAVAASATVERSAPVTAAGEALIALAIPYASTALLGFAAKYAFARERPYATREGLLRRCARGDERGCDWDRNGSFPSLHSALGFAAAGALCVQTLRFGSQGAGDAIGCGLATMSATVGATLRMVADKHYVTDVIVGSLLGLGISTALSWAVHFAPGAPLPLASALYSDRIEPLPVVLGGVLGVFVGAMGVTALSAQWR